MSKSNLNMPVAVIQNYKHVDRRLYIFACDEVLMKLKNFVYTTRRYYYRLMTFVEEKRNENSLCNANLPSWV